METWRHSQNKGLLLKPADTYRTRPVAEGLPFVDTR
jgi:hypothetical protein